MSSVEAIFRRGVFEPLGPVDLREEQRVKLSIALTGGETIQSWLAEVLTIQNAVVERHGPLPDSSGEIAADRLR